MRLGDVKVGMTGTAKVKGPRGLKTYKCKVVQASAGASGKRISVRPTDGTGGDKLIWPSEFTAG